MLPYLSKIPNAVDLMMSLLVRAQFSGGIFGVVIFNNLLYEQEQEGIRGTVVAPGNLRPSIALTQCRIVD